MATIEDAIAAAKAANAKVLTLVALASSLHAGLVAARSTTTDAATATQLDDLISLIKATDDAADVALTEDAMPGDAPAATGAGTTSGDAPAATGAGTTSGDAPAATGAGTTSGDAPAATGAQ